MKRSLVRGVVVWMALAACVLAGDAKKGKTFENVQVNRFECQPDVDLPADYQIAIVEDIAKHLENAKVKRVLRQGEARPEGEATLLITGVFTKYKKGSQAARYLVGFGAGATVVVAQIKFTDAATNEVLLEREVDGKVIIGMMGGKSTGATNGLAKEVVKVAKQKFI